MKIRLMSHNVWGMFAPDVVNKVANRAALMRDVYLAHLPTVIGAQEFSEDIRASGLPEMIAEEYTELDVSENVTAYGMKNLFTPVFYRKSICYPLCAGFFLYDVRFNNHASKGATWGVFRDLASGRLFSIVNTHYWWKSGAEHDAAREQNSKEVLRIAANLPSPIFVMGDLNCTVFSKAYTVLLNGGFADAQITAAKTKDINTHHPYPVYCEDTDCFLGAPAPVGGYEKAIDHFMVDAAHASYVSRFFVLTDERSLTTSDHCPILLDYEEQPTLKIGIFTDAHVSDKATAVKTRRPSLSFEKIRIAMKAFQRKKVRLVVCLGDLLDHCTDPADDEKEFVRLSEMIRSFGIPFRCIQGNHDCENFGERDFYRISGFEKPPFVEKYGECALIFLDTGFHDDGTPYLPGKIDWTNSYLPPNQTERLRAVLSDTTVREAVIFLHPRLYPEDDPRYQLRNSAEIRAILEQSGKVHRVYSGHYHRGSLATLNGITYMTLPALCEGERNPHEVIEI